MKDSVLATAKIVRSSRARKNGGYTASLQITHERFPKKYALTIGPGLDRVVFTQEEFENIASSKPKKHLRSYKYTFSSIEERANKIIYKMEFFSFQEFEQLFFKQDVKTQNDLYVFLRLKMKRLTEAEKENTYVTYRSTEKHLKAYYGAKKLPFQLVTSGFLEKFENWLLDTEKIGSKNTIGIYMRNIRVLYNEAINEKLIDRKNYPFGKKNYQIPKVQKETIKALNKEEVIKIANYQSEIKGKMYAKDMWMFSYLGNGMNIRDICNLKYENITDGKLSFIRSKTINTTRSNQIIIEVELHEMAMSIIDKLGDSNKESYIFPIFKENMSSKEKNTKVGNLNNYITKQIKKVAKELDINKKITTIYARHSFATILRNEGVSIAKISKALGHQNIATTVAYLGKFDDESLKEMSVSLL